MEKQSVGLLHPGQMGATVGRSASVSGADVFWVSAGRSEASQARAGSAGLIPLGSLAELVNRCEIIIAVCPPDKATLQAKAVAELSYRGLYVDANAISPATARNLAPIIETGGGTFVDGGIIGPPASKAGTTRLYVSGVEAARLVDLFCDSPLEAIAIGAAPGAASALKMAYAAYTKGHSALLLAIRALAAAEQIEQPLLREWALSQPALSAASERAAASSAAKAWRFEGEMLEIAETFHAVGLPDGFHRAAAQLYGSLRDFRNCSEPPSIDDVVASLLVDTSGN